MRLPGKQHAGVGSLFCNLATALCLCVSCALDSWETLVLNVDGLLSANASVAKRAYSTVSGSGQGSYVVVAYAASAAAAQGTSNLTSATEIAIPQKILGGLWASCDNVDDNTVRSLKRSGVSWWVSTGHCLYDNDISASELLPSQQVDAQTRQTATRTAQSCLIVSALCVVAALTLELCNLFFLNAIVSLLAATTAFCTGVYVAFALALVTVRMNHPEHFSYNNLDINSNLTISQPASSTWISVATLLVAFLASTSSTVYSHYLREDVRRKAIHVCRRSD